MGRVAVTIIVAITAHVAFCDGVYAARRGRRSVSPSGEFSFQLESHGRVLSTYNYRGRTYVEGRWGKHYQIRVFNHTRQRVEAVVTVDGRDAVSGQIGDYRNQRGYVIDPYGSVIIEGFRTSRDQVAAFRFTDVGDSYAARMGDATNVGVVGVAVFRERTYRSRPRPMVVPRKSMRHGYGGGADVSEAPAAKSAPRRDSEAGDRSYGTARQERRRQNLGTQYGEDTYSPSTSTQFKRRNSRRPDALLAVRYDDRQGLIARGVIQRPRLPYRPEPASVPNPFPGSPEPRFAPPPPPHHYWE
ncbi:MAG: hypothetical protein GY847_35260 [Proteobacteria bacterium]|nr:hypothetical protein [Pseudomonadota bacterium]